MIFLCTLLFITCTAGFGSGFSKATNFDKDASYSLGFVTASSWIEVGIVPDFNELLRGMKDAYAEKTPRFQLEEMYIMLDEAFANMQMEAAEADRLKEIDFLAQNSIKEGIIITDSGLQYEVLNEGRGASPDFDDTVRIHYEMSLVDGVVFDSTYERGEPEDVPMFSIMQFLSGWAEGMQLMNEGSSYRFFVPSDLGYGSRQMSPMIPAYSTIIIKVDLISIVRN